MYPKNFKTRFIYIYIYIYIYICKFNTFSDEIDCAQMNAIFSVCLGRRTKRM